MRQKLSLLKNTKIDKAQKLQQFTDDYTMIMIITSLTYLFDEYVMVFFVDEHAMKLKIQYRLGIHHLTFFLTFGRFYFSYFVKRIFLYFKIFGYAACACPVGCRCGTCGGTFLKN